MVLVVEKGLIVCNLMCNYEIPACASNHICWKYSPKHTTLCKLQPCHRHYHPPITWNSLNLMVSELWILECAAETLTLLLEVRKIEIDSMAPVEAHQLDIVILPKYVEFLGFQIEYLSQIPKDGRKCFKWFRWRISRLGCATSSA